MICNDKGVKSKLSAFSLGIAFGITEGLFMILFAWAGWLFGYGVSMIQQISTVYYGYAPSFFGVLLGGIWGLADGFIFGIVAGYIYNLCFCCCSRKSNSSESGDTIK